MTRSGYAESLEARRLGRLEHSRLRAAVAVRSAAAVAAATSEAARRLMYPPCRGGEGGGCWGIKEISLSLTGCVCAQLATCRASSFATGIGLRSIAAPCWQPHAHSSKRHWRLMRAAARLRPLLARTLHPPIGPGQSPSPFFRVTAFTVAKGHCQGPGTIPGSGSRHSS